jgi:hypothetical protein
MDIVVILDPERGQLWHGCDIWPGMDRGVVAFEGFNQRLADTVSLGTSHQREACDEST